MTVAIDVQQCGDFSGVPDAVDFQRWVNACWPSPGNASSATRHKSASACAGVVLRVVGNEESHELNRTYRHKDHPTNVLSFPYESPDLSAFIQLAVNDRTPEDNLLIDDGSEEYLGDLVFCEPLIRLEAQQQHKPLLNHWAHLVVHGMLHLQGYDHQTETAAEEMETLEIAILSSLGFPDPYAANHSGNRATGTEIK